jgi:putative transposase
MISAPDREKAIELIEKAVQDGACLRLSCEVSEITERTYYRWKKLKAETGSYADLRPTAQRPEPVNKLLPEERQEILETVNKPEYANMPPSEIVPALADQGKYIASESTFYRVLRENDMLHHRGRAAEGTRCPISTHSASAPNQVWMWDITYLYGPVKGMFYYLYMICDLYDRTIVGWEIWPEETAEHASELISRAVISQRITPPMNMPLVLHSDNGSPMKGATMLATLYKLGITPSNSRPRVSNDNPYAESLFKTVKYHCSYPTKGFATIEGARLWCSRFVNWYNNDHHHSGLKFLTPSQRRNGTWKKVLSNRSKVYEAAKARHPERWNGRDTRDWTLPELVWLNPEKYGIPEETILKDTRQRSA